MSLLQAFSLGLPAIVTDVGGMAEAVRLAQAGFTVPVSDPAGMAGPGVAESSGEPFTSLKAAGEEGVTLKRASD